MVKLIGEAQQAGRLTMVYKILNGLVAIPPEEFFNRSTSCTRKNHNSTLQTYQSRGNIDKFAFAQRSIPEWNKTAGICSPLKLTGSLPGTTTRTLITVTCDTLSISQAPLFISCTQIKVHLRDRLYSPLKITKEEGAETNAAVTPSCKDVP